MLLFGISPSSFMILLIFSFSFSPIDAKPTLALEQPSPAKSTQYKRLASYCYINDYNGWLQRQQELIIWFDIAKTLRLPIDDDEQFLREVEQFRLQHQCLRLMERLPVSVGPG